MFVSCFGLDVAGCVQWVHGVVFGRLGAPGSCRPGVGSWRTLWCRRVSCRGPGGRCRVVLGLVIYTPSMYVCMYVYICPSSLSRAWRVFIVRGVPGSLANAALGPGPGGLWALLPRGVPGNGGAYCCLRAAHPPEGSSLFSGLTSPLSPSLPAPSHIHTLRTSDGMPTRCSGGVLRDHSYCTLIGLAPHF